jgi:RNA polymerase-binding protein DksA
VAATPGSAKAAAKTVRKKADAAAVAPKPAAKPAPKPAAPKPVTKASKPAQKPARKPAVKAVKATKPVAKAPAKQVRATKPTAKPAKTVKAPPAKAVRRTKASAQPVARNISKKKSPEVAQVAEPKAKRAGTATKAPAKAAPAAAPAEVSAGFPAKTLDKLRRLLEEDRETYLRQAHDLAAEAEALAAEREPGDTQFDEESGEGDTLNVERERDLALSASATQAVEDIDRALRRMDLGTYGICERCGKKITVARLEALPFAALCIECKSREERRR